MTSIGSRDGQCTFWFDGDWQHCCVIHDQAYLDGAVTLQTHIDLGLCVAQTSGGVIMGTVMFLGTALWWALKYKIMKKGDK